MNPVTIVNLIRNKMLMPHSSNLYKIIMADMTINNALAKGKIISHRLILLCKHKS